MPGDLELCRWCDDPTGRAGRHDDSLYTEDGQGPFCEGCFEGAEMDCTLRGLRAEVASLTRAQELLTESQSALSDLLGRAARDVRAARLERDAALARAEAAEATVKRVQKCPTFTLIGVKHEEDVVYLQDLNAVIAGKDPG